MNEPQKECFAVRIVRAVRGGTFVTAGEFGMGERMAAIQKAEELQREFDRSCDPVRCYIIGGDGIPVAAAYDLKWRKLMDKLDRPPSSGQHRPPFRGRGARSQRKNRAAAS